MAENNEKITAEATTSKHERRTSGTRHLKLSRLPTLQEVLDRRTRPPLDLFCFYVGGKQILRSGIFYVEAYRLIAHCRSVRS